MIQALQTGLDIGWIIFCLYATPVLIVALPVLAGAWAIWEFWVTPPESRKIRTAHRQHKSLNLLATDDGFYDLEITQRAGPEGAIETAAKGKHNEHWTGFLARQHPLNGTIEVDDGYDAEKTRNVANFINDLASRRAFLRGAKVPLNVGYKGKAIVTSLYNLAGLSVAEAIQQHKDDPKGFLEKFSTMMKEKGFPVDILALKTLFDSSWNESQVLAQEADKERLGEQRARRKMGDRMPFMWLIIATGFALGMGVLLTVIFYLITK